ncbi:nitrogenase iron protein [bacterium]|nr:nitrogenase iron protein [bacterium]
MRQIAFYGKGGIGKSTIVANAAAAIAGAGHQVMQVGCDPKRDSTRMLLGGQFNPTVLEKLHSDSQPLTVASIVTVGFNGVKCIEAGGPEPGVGCAGRGITATFQMMEKLGLYDNHTEFILYDVLGDVVCGGFAVPIRESYADEVYLITSGELMSLYAANNIAKGIARFSDNRRGKLAGVIGNSRNLDNEKRLIAAFAERIGTRLIKFIPRDMIVQQSEIRKQTVMQFAPDSPQAQIYRELAVEIVKNTHRTTPTPMEIDELEELAFHFSQ